LPTLVPSVLIAIFLVVVARPLAVVACLLPFRFAWNEHAFVAWVGLRGAVAIFLGTIPILAGLENASIYFEVAFAVVLVSLCVQGWTLARAARRLDVELPPLPRTPVRIDVDLPVSGDRDLMIYTVGSGSRISLRGVRRVLQLENPSLLGAVRDGRLVRPRDLDRLEPGDSVMVLAPPAQAAVLDELFAERPASDSDADFGAFMFDGDLPVGKIADFYDQPLPEEHRAMPLADFIPARLRRRPLIGDRVRLTNVALVVRAMRDERISQVGIDLEPRQPPRPSLARQRARLRRSWAWLRRWLPMFRR
jgi:cell volume regulation protein A